MDAAPSEEVVKQAILSLYGTDPLASGNASVWLGEFQKSVHAWTLCDRLLDASAAGGGNDLWRYFGAQTMRAKVQSSFHELPAESYASLRDSLLRHLEDSAGLPADTGGAIVTQLCLALADLCLQVAEWQSFVSDLLTRLSGSSRMALLVLLKVLPEETDSRHLRLGANRRQQVFADLAQHTPAVLQFLSEVCSKDASDEESLARAFGALAGWLNNPVCPTDQLAQSALLAAILQLLKSPEAPSRLHDAATECVVAALFRAENVEKCQALAQQLYSAIHEMSSAYQMAVANEDFDKVQNYGRLFTELAETVLPSMVEYSGDNLGDLATIDLLLNGIGFHDYMIAEMSFNFWYRLSEYLYQRDMPELTKIFRPYVERLIAALYRHCRFDADHFALLQEGVPDENEDFSEFRAKVTEVLRDVVFVIGSDTCFKQMFDFLKSQSATSTWDETEAALFIMTSIAKNVHPQEDEVTGQVVGAILSLPASTHVCIRYTALRLLGQLHEWLEHNPEYCEGVLVWVLDCLTTAQLAPTAADALSVICAACKRRLTAHFDRLAAALLSLDAACPAVSEEAVISLLQAAATVLSCQNGDQMAANLNRICAKQAERLAQLVRAGGSATENNNALNNNENDGSAAATSDPSVWLDRLAAVFRQLAPSSPAAAAAADNGAPRPWLPVVQELWPLLSETCAKYEANARVVEHSCRAIRFTIRSLGYQSLPFVQPLVSQMVDIYSRQPHSCFLYLGSVLVDEYGANQQFVPGLVYMLEAFVGPTFKLLNAANGLQNNPDTVDDLFRLCTRFIQRAPAAFFECGCCATLLDCATAALVLDHADANASVARVFVETSQFLSFARQKGLSSESGVMAAERLVAARGAVVVTAVLVAAIYHLPSRFIRDMAEILFAFSNLDQQTFGEWLASALRAVPRRGATHASDQQLALFHTESVQAKDLKTMRRALSELVHLYR